MDKTTTKGDKMEQKPIGMPPVDFDISHLFEQQKPMLPRGSYLDKGQTQLDNGQLVIPPVPGTKPTDK